MSRQAEVLQSRAMLSSVTFNPGISQLSVTLDGSHSASAVLNAGQIEVSINGVVTGDSPAEDTVSSITIDGGNGGHTIDLSGLTGPFSALMMSKTITTGSGDDYITGSAVMDVIDSGAGNDTVHGGSGVDNINGGPGNDILHGDEDAGDSIFGDTGDDELWSGTGIPDGGTYALDGGPDTDLIDGEPEVDTPDEPDTPTEQEEGSAPSITSPGDKTSIE